MQTEQKRPVEFTHHLVSFQKLKDGREQATCLCGWSYLGDTRLECQLKASIHDLD